MRVLILSDILVIHSQPFKQHLIVAIDIHLQLIVVFLFHLIQHLFDRLILSLDILVFIENTVHDISRYLNLIHRFFKIGHIIVHCVKSELLSTLLQNRHYLIDFVHQDCIVGVHFDSACDCFHFMGHPLKTVTLVLLLSCVSQIQFGSFIVAFSDSYFSFT